MPQDWKSRLRQLLLKARLVGYMLLAHARRILIGSRVKALLCQTQNGLIAVPPGDFYVGRRLAYQGRYDLPALQQLLPMVTETSHLVVVGAHIGAMLVPLGKQAGQLDAVEANPAMYPFIETNLLMNGLTNVRVHRVAAGEGEGVQEFLQSRVDSGGSRMRPSGGSLFEFVYDRPSVIQVPVQPLDSFIPGGPVEVLLMDIGGGEYAALKGAQQLLARSKHLQIPIRPHLIDHVAKVDRQAFLGQIAPHFQTARATAAGVEKDYARDQFFQLMEDAYSQHYLTGLDVLFSQ